MLLYVIKWFIIQGRKVLEWLHLFAIEPTFAVEVLKKRGLPHV